MPNEFRFHFRTLEPLQNEGVQLITLVPGHLFRECAIYLCEEHEKLH